jgi:hypothetical protein
MEEHDVVFGRVELLISGLDIWLAQSTRVPLAFDFEDWFEQSLRLCVLGLIELIV